MYTHVFGSNFQENYLFIYLFLETKLIIAFQGIVLHTDIIIAF